MQGNAQTISGRSKPLSFKPHNLQRVEDEEAKVAARVLLDGNAAAATVEKLNAGQLKSDAEIAKSVVECVGTFRWRDDKVLPTLPRSTAATAHAQPPLPQKHGWAPWLNWRCPDNAHAAVQLAQSDPSLLDGLSFPLSLCFAMEQVGLSPAALKQASTSSGDDGGGGGGGGGGGARPRLTVLVLGATVSAEQRLVYDSDYWAEFTARYAFADIHFVMVGPECDDQFLDTAKEGQGGRRARLGGGDHVTVEAVHGVLRPLLEARPELAQWHYANDATRSVRGRPGALQAATIAVGFNPGFGSGSPGLVQSWASDNFVTANLVKT